MNPTEAELFCVYQLPEMMWLMATLSSLNSKPESTRAYLPPVRSVHPPKLAGHSQSSHFASQGGGWLRNPHHAPEIKPEQVQEDLSRWWAMGEGCRGSGGPEGLSAAARVEVADGDASRWSSDRGRTARGTGGGERGTGAGRGGCDPAGGR